MNRRRRAFAALSLLALMPMSQRWLQLKQEPSALESSWDLRDSAGARVPSGLYMAVARTKSESKTLAGDNGFVLVP